VGRRAGCCLRSGTAREPGVAGHCNKVDLTLSSPATNQNPDPDDDARQEQTCAANQLCKLSSSYVIQ